MTDRELLELAAKAAGLNYSSEYGCYFDDEYEQGCDWNPLDDDGDALRLAVGMGMNLCLVPAGAFSIGACGFDVNGVPTAEVVEPHGNDPHAATRRAIVRAAAEIGRGM